MLNSHPMNDQPTPQKAVLKLQSLKTACRRKIIVPNEIKMIVDEQPELLHEIVDDNLRLTLFLLACDKGWDDVVEHLLNNHSKNTDINQANRNRFTGLYLAASKGWGNCVRMLLSRPDIDVNPPIGPHDKAVIWNCANRECFELLLPHYPLMSENEAKMAWLWSRYFNSKEGAKKLKVMLEEFSHESLSELRDDMARLLWNTLFSQDDAMFRYLLASYGDVININVIVMSWRTCLHQAVSANKVDSVKLLLSHPDIDVNVVSIDESGRTALHNACFFNYEECIDLLLAHPGIETTIRDKYHGKTAEEMKGLGVNSTPVQR